MHITPALIFLRPTIQTYLRVLDAVFLPNLDLLPHSLHLTVKIPLSTHYAAQASLHHVTVQFFLRDRHR